MGKLINVQKGLGLLALSIILVLVGSCLTVLSVMWPNVANVLAWVGIVLVLVGSVLELVGLIVAGKDETNHFKQSMYMVIANIILYVSAVIFGAIPNGVCQSIAGTIYNATPILDMLVIIEVILGCREVSPKTVSNKDVNVLMISVIILTVLQILTNNFSVYLHNMISESGAVQIWSTIIVVCCVVFELFVDVTYIFVVFNTREGLKHARPAK